MKHKILAYTLALSALVSTSAHAQVCDNWDRTDTTLATMAVAATLADWRQTQEIAKDNGKRWVEMNPLIGGRKQGKGYVPEMRDVNRHFVASLTLGAVAACMLPSEYRKMFLGGAAALELGIVIQNHNKGIQIKVNF
jgi:hypothetical protein